MAFSVIRLTKGLVRPAEETPSTILDLSVIDRLPALRCNARTLHVFKHGPEAEIVISQALSKALVPYYPLAGRLKESNHGYLQVECSGDGVWFVEASAGCTLESVNYFDDVSKIPYDVLLPDQIPETENVEPLVQLQVTKFSCGGFVIGLIFCHSICDGLGAAQFLNAVGELARALDNPSITPVWHRHFFPTPPQQANAIALPNLPPPIPNYRLQHTNIDIPLDHIHQLKQKFQEVTKQSCSAFEIVAAGFWRNRTRSISFKENTQVKLVFFANCRHLLDPPLPKGFYGNCFFPVTITATCDFLMEATIVDVVKLIQEAKGKLPIEFGRYFKGEHLKDGNEDPFSPPLDYTTLFISEWGRLGFNQVDYQWGPPVHVVPIQGSSIIPVGIVGSLPLPNKGIRLMTWCVEEAHCQPFLDNMGKLSL
ncbi:3'-N-debenzoyl-2'-deoxytaxol N-benzoyltransferase-like [Quillaja saponaria]|uniref:3'-N-debenzoyl-2'-deoxytaxol N-benzoyltransferase-like n=1 Tax=Quillaja saponaria TaxID=32244 RepID=A0AAD7Q1H8_QUISA|nr:3'-N-debenzoyl-2'-deoxytaxol N-benzoyltransferase-like [Quillaja saponaria]